MRLKLNVGIVLISVLIVGSGFALLEPSFSLAVTDTDTVAFNQTVTTGISISHPTDVTMTALSTSQNSAVGTVDYTVITNSFGGYTLTVYAGASPAMVRASSAGNIADYTPASANVPETWSVSAAAEFGFSARGTNVATGTWGTDSDCIAAADVPSTALLWRDFDLVGSPTTIASSNAATSTSGATSSLCVADEQVGTFAQSGSYTATITATATSQ